MPEEPTTDTPPSRPARGAERRPPGRGKVGRAVSRMLRHRPDELLAGLDPEGWADVTDVARAVGRHVRSFVSPETILEVCSDPDNPRFEIDETRTAIRARYGHSEHVAVDPPVATPPATLFHATPEGNVVDITTEGLRPLTRRYVHLHAHRAGAVRGVRHHQAAWVLYEVDTGSAGTTFRSTDGRTWLAEHVPAHALRLVDSPEGDDTE